MNGPALPGPGGSGHLQLGRPSALALDLALAPACWSPGAGESRLGSALPLERTGSFRDPSPGYRS